MKGLGISNKGFEDISAKEVKEILKKDCEIKEGCVIFDIDELEDLALLSYKAQSLNRVILYLGKGDNPDNIDFSLLKGKFCAKHENLRRDFDAAELDEKIGEHVSEKLGLKVSFSDPDYTVFSFISDEIYIGIDFSGDISKRDYKIYNTKFDLRATVAFSLIRLAELDSGVFVDPICGAGIIPIEAALYYSGKSINFFEKNKFPFLKFLEYNFEDEEKENNVKIYAYDSQIGFLSSAKKNAKVAGINKMISFSRQNLDWLELKFGKEKVDIIVSRMISPSKTITENKAKQIYKELFYQAEYILKNSGKVILISRENNILKQEAEEHKFKLSHERKIWQGKDELKVSLFEKIGIYTQNL